MKLCVFIILAIGRKDTLLLQSKPLNGKNQQAENTIFLLYFGFKPWPYSSLPNK